MSTKLSDFIEKAAGKMKKAVVAGANDPHVLEAVIAAHAKKCIMPVLVGPSEGIKRTAGELGVDISGYEIVEAPDENRIARTAVELMHRNEADILIKGLINTAVILKQVLNKDFNLNTGSILSHVGCFEIPGFERLIFVTDSALNIAPDLDQKVGIIQNAITVARRAGIEKPRVAVISSNEKVSLKLPSSVDASILAKMADRGTFGSGEETAIVDGPLALDIAISKEALDIKGISSPVEGVADILVMPHIDAGNVLYKSLIYFAHAETAGVIVGSRKPVVVTSRADSALSKLYSIALAALMT